MFDESLPGLGSLSELDDAALIDAMTSWDRAVAAADARRLAVMAEFTARRMGGTEFADWVADEYTAASVEVGAALNVSMGNAGRQMDLAMTLRTRLPRVAAQYAAGAVNARTIATISWRTGLVRDRSALETLDEALAERIAAYGSLSKRKLEAAIDVWITAVDPHALRRTRCSARGREVVVGDANDHDGITSVWARLLSTDAKLLDSRLAAMAKAVCEADPRTLAQRRADALGALAAGSSHLACACNGPACPAATPDGRAGSVVVHVLTDAQALGAEPDPYCHGEDHDDPEWAAPAPGAASPAPPRRPAVIVGGPILPPTLLAELIKSGAKVRYLSTPSTDPEPRYRPSTALDEWVRMRDLTCRAPGCDVPAVGADIDHTEPWPSGPTHASNTKCYCRLHHLTKTFWDGFSDRQHPDGTITWTTPTGHTYTTLPFGRVLYPTWNTTTARLSEPPDRPSPDPARGLRMPRRKRTRASEREYRIEAERKLNAAEDLPPPF